MMMTEDLSEDLKKYIHDLERKIAQLEKDLEKESAGKETFRQSNKKLKKENEKLKKELARLQGSAPVLAGSDKTAEAGGVPTSKVFYKRNRQEGNKKAVEYTENDPPPSMEERKNACKEFHKEMKAFLDRKRTDADAVRISKELRKRLDMLFTFMDHEGVPWHNNDAERAIRQGVLHRKISGGRSGLN